MKIAILGEGAWGTAIATLLANNGHEVFLWCHDATVKAAIEKNRTNATYLPGIILDHAIVPVTSLDVLQQAHYIFEAVPVKFLRSVIQQAKSYYHDEQIWVVLSKGIEQDTLLVPTAMLDQILAAQVKKAVIVGPSYAQNVAKREYTAVALAADSCAIAKSVAQLVNNQYFHAYLTTDVLGVQWCAAIKNCIAIGIGMLDAAGYGDNAKSFLLTAGLSEMAALCTRLGGDSTTAYGLAGIGDLVLTAMGTLSKNQRVGMLLVQGYSLDDIAQQFGAMPEGINTIQSIHQLLEKTTAMPLLSGMYDMIFHYKTIDEFMCSVLQAFEKQCQS